jgi:hypothetical protein
MKMTILLAALLFCCFTSLSHAATSALPLDKKISAEKLSLAEDYPNALRKCRAHKSQVGQDSCIDRQKELLAKALQDLEKDPKAYFTVKERSTRDENTVKEARRLIAPPGKRIDRN